MFYFCILLFNIFKRHEMKVMFRIDQSYLYRHLKFKLHEFYTQTILLGFFFVFAFCALTEVNLTMWKGVRVIMNLLPKSSNQLYQTIRNILHITRAYRIRRGERGALCLCTNTLNSFLSKMKNSLNQGRLLSMLVIRPW